MEHASSHAARVAIALVVALVVGSIVAPVIIRVTTEREVARRFARFEDKPKLRVLVAGYEAYALEVGDIATGEDADDIVAHATNVPRFEVGDSRSQWWEHFREVERYCLQGGCCGWSFNNYWGSRGSPHVYISVTALAALLALLATVALGRFRAFD